MKSYLFANKSGSMKCEERTQRACFPCFTLKSLLFNKLARLLNARTNLDQENELDAFETKIRVKDGLTIETTENAIQNIKAARGTYRGKCSINERLLKISGIWQKPLRP